MSCKLLRLKSYILSRDACINAAYAVVRAASVCPSITFVYRVETNKDITIRYPHRSSVSVANLIAIFWWEPHNRVSNAGKVWKIAIFDQYLALFRKWYKI